jgi:uncharacterized protein with FMN-binding domain
MLTLAWIVIAGCATAPCRFQVVGNVTIPASAQHSTSPQIRTAIADALEPFGFTGGEREHDGPYFYSLGGHGFNSKERIDVRLEPKSLQIGLIDHNHSTETDFVRRIIASIDQEIVSTYGTTVDFIPRTNRWTDCLGP